MKYLDFAIQTILFVLAIILLITSYGEAGWPFTTLYIQLLIGIWQFLSSAVAAVNRSGFYKLKRIHLFISSVYLIFFVLMPKASLSPPIITLSFIVPAWLLAIYYYTITCKWVFLKTRKRGSFLPNLSF